MMDRRASLLAQWGAPLVSVALWASPLAALSPETARGEQFTWATRGPAIFAPAKPAGKPTVERLPPVPFGRGPVQFPPSRARPTAVAAAPIVRLPAPPQAPLVIERLPPLPDFLPAPEQQPDLPAVAETPAGDVFDGVPDDRGPVDTLPALDVPAADAPTEQPPASQPATGEGPLLNLGQTGMQFPAPEQVERLPSLPEAVAESPSPPETVSPLVASPHRSVSSAMANVSRQAETHIQRGMSLGDRRAYYSARVEFVQALKLVAGALDAEQATDRHSQALAAGLQALDEADEFVPKEADLSANMNVAAVAAVHRTPVVRTAPEGVSSTVALQKYYTYAQEQLGASVEQSPAGSSALAALGKLHSVMASDSTAKVVAAEPKALALHQAALLADGENSVAANELGVLLARFGRYEDACAWLEFSVALAPLPTTWHNLSVVHEQLGQPQLAEQARRQQLARQQGRAKVASNLPDVRWVTSQEFTGQVKPASAAPAASGGARDGVVRLPNGENQRRE